MFWFDAYRLTTEDLSLICHINSNNVVQIKFKIIGHDKFEIMYFKFKIIS